MRVREDFHSYEKDFLLNIRTTAQLDESCAVLFLGTFQYRLTAFEPQQIVINYTISRSFSHNTTHVVCQIAILCYCLIVEFVVTLQS